MDLDRGQFPIRGSFITSESVCGKKEGMENGEEEA
jgi:hypothetical protein